MFRAAAVQQLRVHYNKLQQVYTPCVRYTQNLQQVRTAATDSHTDSHTDLPTPGKIVTDTYNKLQQLVNDYVKVANTAQQGGSASNTGGREQEATTNANPQK